MSARRVKVPANDPGNLFSQNMVHAPTRGPALPCGTKADTTILEHYLLSVSGDPLQKSVMHPGLLNIDVARLPEAILNECGPR